ncbi:hypothetical protein QM565_30420 [Geitlerinema splendidum]|nr:hypothetical protein [Geitlerinema splendidum]
MKYSFGTIRSEPVNWWRFRAPLEVCHVKEVHGFELEVQRSTRREPLFVQTDLFEDSLFEEETVDREKLQADGEPGFKWLVTGQRPESVDEFKAISVFSQVDHYLLDSKAGLHREFTKCAGSEEKLVKFANSYGFLGSNVTLVTLQDGRQVWAECLGQWLAESYFVKCLIELWEEFSVRRNAARLSEIVFPEHDLVTFDETIYGGRESIYSGISEEFHYDNTPVILRQEKTEFSAARQLLEGHLNRVLTDIIGTEIELLPRPHLKIQAKTLIGQIYMHLIQEMTGVSGKLVKCSQCDSWFRSEHKGTMYCSDACKVRAYRKRKENASGEQAK